MVSNDNEQPDYDNSWPALLDSAQGSDFFIHPQRPSFHMTGEFDLGNAWWLAEMSRLIYKQEADEVGADADRPRRNTVLNRVDWREEWFLNDKGTQCALFVSMDLSMGVLVFRGSNNVDHWLSNLETIPVKWPDGGWVHKGFADSFQAVFPEVARRLTSFQGPLMITGHSRGAALATMAADRLVSLALYTFGSPRVGDTKFCSRYQNKAVYRVVNNRDIVPQVPPSVPGLEFCHVGGVRYISHHNALWTDPDETTMNQDRQQSASSLATTTNFRRWYDPPELLSDHAPINYVVHLKRFHQTSQKPIT